MWIFNTVSFVLLINLAATWFCWWTALVVSSWCRHPQRPLRYAGALVSKFGTFHIRFFWFSYTVTLIGTSWLQEHEAGSSSAPHLMALNPSSFCLPSGFTWDRHLLKPSFKILVLTLPLPIHSP